MHLHTLSMVISVFVVVFAGLALPDFEARRRSRRFEAIRRRLLWAERPEVDEDSLEQVRRPQ